jgi:hypothetical protein
MAELVRHRQTKEADTDMFAPKVTAPHLNSTGKGQMLLPRLPEARRQQRDRL